MELEVLYLEATGKTSCTQYSMPMLPMPLAGELRSESTPGHLQSADGERPAVHD